MTDDRTIHPVTLSLGAPLPEALDAGAPFRLRIAVEAGSDADLAGAAYQVFEGDAVVASGHLPPLVRPDPDSDAYDPRHGPVDPRPMATLALAAPDRIGTAHWTLVVPAIEIDGAAHAAAELALTVTTKAHEMRLTVWDAASPVAAGETFSVKVGAKCSACCALAGRWIELFDEEGQRVGTGLLGEACWPGTEATYWTQISARAPSVAGAVAWTARLAAAPDGTGHAGGEPEAVARLRFLVTEAPAHRVSITLCEKESDAPVADAMVRLGVHRKPTDRAGRAEFAVPAGEHALFVSKAGYAMPQRTLAVAGDLDLPLCVEPVPPEDPYARWTG